MDAAELVVDAALLERARAVLGTSNTRDTLERALSLAIQEARLRQAIGAEVSRLESGRYCALPEGRGSLRPQPKPGSDPAGSAMSLVPLPAGVLIDTSALAVSDHRQVSEGLAMLIRSGTAVTCPLLDAEALSVARSPEEYAELATSRQLAYRSIPLSAAIGTRMAELQALLARHVHLGAAAPGDLQVAATALEHELRLVHYSAVFELLGQLARLDQVPVAPLGSLR